MSTIYSNSNSRLLFEKCRNNESEKAIEMINDKDNLRINVNERFEGGCTSFFICCYLGNLKVAKELVDKGNADVTLDSDSIKPFTVACVQGKISIVDYLLSEHGNKIDPDSIITGLVGACQYGFPQIVRRILNRGIDINLRIDDQGATLIYVAVETQNESIVSLLLNYHSLGGGDNSSGESSIVNTNISRAGYYPIHLASQNANIKILEMLLKNQDETDVDVQTPDGATSLLIAAQNGSIKVVDLLLKYKADPNIQMKSDGSTPLYVAAARHHNVTVEILLDLPNLDVTKVLIDGTTVLHVFSQFGYLDLIEKMFKNFPNSIPKIINAKKLDGSTSLHLAARHGQHQVCQFLIDNGADISIECDGDTALSICKRYGRTETIKVLENATKNKIN